MNDTTSQRRHNVLALYKAFADRTLAAGGTAKGLEQAFAETMQIKASRWSQIKSSRPIGDKLARQIESQLGKPVGWLDMAHEDTPAPTEAEQAFLDLALRAYRGTNAKGRAALRSSLRDIVGS